MKKSILTWTSIGVLAFLFFFSAGAVAKEPAELSAKIEDAASVIRDFTGSPDKEAPQSLLRKAAAVAIFPTVVKGAFIVGGEYGKGVIVSYDKKYKRWSAPAFFTIGGGSVGWQIGGEAIDMILVIRNERGLSSLLKGKVKLGGDISVAAGPIGRSAEANTDVLLTAEIYSYSRAKGLFAGLSFEGAVVAPNNDDNAAYYGKTLSARDILIGHQVHPDGAGKDLVRALESFIGRK